MRLGRVSALNCAKVTGQSGRELRLMTESRRPLFAMLSQLLIAYTYEFDAALAHELGRRGSGDLPSLAMFANVLQFVGDGAIGEEQLQSLCGIAPPTLKTMLRCLERHGWISMAADGAVQLSPAGSDAARAFPKANEAVERRWEAQCGADAITTLRRALEKTCARLPRGFPQYPMTAAHRGAFPRGE